MFFRNLQIYASMYKKENFQIHYKNKTRYQNTMRQSNIARVTIQTEQKISTTNKMKEA